MKKTSKLFVLFLFIALSVNAQRSASSLLWKVSGNGLEEPSYIFGTYHLLCPDDLKLSDKLLAALGEAEQLVLEIDFDDPSMMGILMSGMMFKDGTTAGDYLSTEEYKLVADFFNNKLHMPFESLAKVKPFFLASLTVSYYMQCQPVSIEMELSKRANEQEKEVLGLELVEEQLQFVDSISMENAVKILVSSVEEADQMNEMSDEIVTAYLDENLAALDSLINAGMGDEYAEINTELLLERNLKWVPAIEELINSNSSLIAVGAGHLTGTTGILKLLEEEGYLIEPVMDQNTNTE